MEQSVLNNLLDSMEAYFEADDANEDGSDAKKEKIKISERFRRNIIRPFRDYTDKENWVEQYKQAQGDGIGYFRREFIRKNDKGPVYGFYSTDANANPENGAFSIGDRVTVIDTNGTEHGVYTGVVEDIDDESDDAVILSIAIYHQADDIDIPLTGKLVMAVNDTQTRVRSKVIRSMERCKLESKYMYHVFDDFSVDGYEEIQDDLKDYLVEKMASQYPPNQMQLEAIIKGILTEDLLLVLGPPGTGKTTVISFWVEYFIKKGLRVLISSQNNAAVDNVLARFGTIAETVRLGNENKVQDNCKAYLPQNKIASMQDYYNQNYDRVQEELEYNKEEIRLYKGRLEIYKKLYETYFERKKVLDEYIAMNRENMRRIAELYENVEKVEKELDSLLEYRARKEIFLQVYETKSFLVRLLRKRYFNRAKAELEEGEPYLKTLREKYVQSIDAYNSMTKVAEQQNLEYRDKNVESAYNESLRLLKEYSQKTSTDEFLPKFRGEISKLYDTPCFEIEPSNNWTIIMSEAEALASLEKIISKMSRALGEWNDIVNNERNDIMQNALLETCKIVGATCIGINSNKDFANVKFDVAIIDEAGQIQIHNALIPMSRARKNLLLGDYKQIPPCANDDVVAACEADEIDTKLLNMSFFEYIFEAMRKKTIDRLESQGLDRSLILKPVLEDYEAEPYKKFEPETVQDMIKRVTEDPKKLVNLNSQFRMPGNISDIISEWFYEGNYHSSYNMDKFSAIVPGTDKPLVVISTSKAKKRKESQPASKMGFLEYVGENSNLRLLYFHTFLCPIAMAEAMVKEHIIEDYGALELLVLRLYEAGFHDSKEIASLSGMKETMIERVLSSEINVYHHIDISTGEITDMGWQTLKENEQGNSVSHVMYDTPRRLQIEAATGTVIPSFLEENNIKRLKSVLEERADGVVPRESVEYDEELRNEINERLLEYKHMDILNEGDTIKSIESLRTTQIYYRWAYLVKFEGMKYPMVVMQGNKSICNVNAESIKNGNYGKKVVQPLSISETDAAFLKENGFVFEDVLVRRDDVFEYLNEKTLNFRFQQEQTEIEIEDENAVFEDERIVETEDAELEAEK